MKLSINYKAYSERFLEALDDFVKDNIEELTGRDLHEFYYEQIFQKLKEYFGGSWGFQGITEFLIFRVLYYIGVERYGKPSPVNITKDLKGFHFDKPNLVLSAGRPLLLNEKRIWVDITIYEPSRRNKKDISRIKSAIEIKAYPQGGIKEIVNTIERLKNIYELYKSHNPKLALIIYDYPVRNKQRSKVWKYLNKENVKDYEPIPDYIDVIILSNQDSALTLLSFN